MKLSTELLFEKLQTEFTITAYGNLSSADGFLRPFYMIPNRLSIPDRFMNPSINPKESLRDTSALPTENA